MKIIPGKQLKFYQTWHATEELYFSHIEARLVGFSGTRTIQKRKHVEAIKGFIREAGGAKHFLGIILNQVNSESHADYLCKAFKSFEIPKFKFLIALITAEPPIINNSGLPIHSWPLILVAKASKSNCLI